MPGIIGYGAYVPCYRIKAEIIARQWGGDPEAVKKGLLLEEKTVPGLDEDTITISVQAARYALQRAGINPTEIGAVYIGSESHPYAVKPSGTVLIDALGIGPEVHVADYEFACKAGTEAMFVAYSHVRAGHMKYALGIGADTSQGAPGDALEYTASAGGAAFIMGTENVTAEILETYSYTSDTADFWRKEGEFYPSTPDGSPANPPISDTSWGLDGVSWRKAAANPRTSSMPCFTCPTVNSPCGRARPWASSGSRSKRGGW